MLNNFENKVALITGAASGLGLAIAQKLAEYGVKLALLDKNREGLLRIQSQLQGENEIYSPDVTLEQQVKMTIAEVQQRFGTIHILINSAGIVGETNIKSHDVVTENIKRVMDVNFIGSFLTSKYCLPLMLQQDYGRI